MHVRILNMTCRLLKRYFYFFTFLPFYPFQLPFTFLPFYPFTPNPVFLPFYSFTFLPFKPNWTGREDAPTGPCYPKNSN